MTYYCPHCGVKLEPVKVDHDIWIEFYRCNSPKCDMVYAKVVDMRNEYPLVEVFPNIPEKLNVLPASSVSEAWSKVQFIDYKTVSLVDFEKYVLGV